jgi:hypothetical protein
MKPLHQLFYILKMQILIYRYIYIYCLFLCCVMGLGLWTLSWPSFIKQVGSVDFVELLYCPTIFILSGMFLEQGLLSSKNPKGNVSFFWTRALDRKLIQLSDIVLYAVFVIIFLLPTIAQLGQSQQPLQIVFQSPEENGAFQRALLADPHLGAHQFYDNAKRIIVAIPHGWDYRIGLQLFQILFLSLFLLWIFKGLNLPERYPIRISRFFNILWFLPMFMFYIALWEIPSVNRFLDDTLFYGDRFMLYAKYHLWLWGGLALAAIFLIQSIIRKYLRPA